MKEKLVIRDSPSFRHLDNDLESDNDFIILVILIY